MENPFSGPGGMADEIFAGDPPHGIFAISIIMTELIYISISFIGDPFPVSIHIARP